MIQFYQNSMHYNGDLLQALDMPMSRPDLISRNSKMPFDSRASTREQSPVSSLLGNTKFGRTPPKEKVVYFQEKGLIERGVSEIDIRPLNASPWEQLVLPSPPAKGWEEQCNKKRSRNGKLISNDKKQSKKLAGTPGDQPSKEFDSDFSKKYKTEICKNFNLHGTCKWGEKCSFAHGSEELRLKTHINLHYKSKMCTQFFENGFCSYGSRCQYLHTIDNYQSICDSFAEKLNLWIKKNPKLSLFKISKKTHPFGSRLPISIELGSSGEEKFISCESSISTYSFNSGESEIAQT